MTSHFIELYTPCIVVIFWWKTFKVICGDNVQFFFSIFCMLLNLSHAIHQLLCRVHIVTSRIHVKI